MGAFGHARRNACTARRLAAVLILLVTCSAVVVARRADAQGFSGELSYTGSLGPVNSGRPLCVCIYTDAQLTKRLGCVIDSSNDTRYFVNTRAATDYFAVAFLDIHVNERLDPDEPYQIFHDRAAVPADPVVGNSGRADVDFVFGDENLPGAATPTPTVTPLAALAGDCDRSGDVSVDELIRAVRIVLGTVDLSTCPAADVNGDGRVRVDEVIRAVAVALADSPTAARE
jgi:hypothetical protein